MLRSTKKPLVILEMANNHMGDVKHAKKIINEYFKITRPFSKDIDFAFKFQFRHLETYIHEDFINVGHKQVNRFIETRLKDSEWKEILIFAKKKFKLICTAFDEKSVDKIVKSSFDYLKIASCSISEWPLLQYISKFAKKKKIICSLGGASKDEIKNTISFFSNRKINVQYLYCVAKYPTKPKDLNLAFFSYLRNIYGNLICGFSTHELPDENLSGSISYSIGSRIFEKHVGLKTQKYKLNKYSASPKQLLNWLINLQDTITRYGSINNREKFLKEEKANLLVFKRGAYLKKNISKKKGESLKIQDLRFAYPSIKKQIVSNDFSKFNTFKVKKNIRAGMPILKNYVSIKNTRTEIEKIRDRILYLINKSKVVISKQARIEVSHHYGLKKFNKFGLCMITILNSKYCKKLLFIFKNQKHPFQFHKKKQETFFILYGQIKLMIKRNKKTLVKILKEGDIATIHPKDIHSFLGMSSDGSVIEELSTKSEKIDSFYIDKSINQNKDRKSFISLN